MEIDRVVAELRKNYPYGHEDFIPMLVSLMKLHSEKNKDYAQQGDSLGNFYRVSDMCKAVGINLSPAQVAFVYMLKQVDAAGRMLGMGYEGETEGVDTRLSDVGVYSGIIRILQKREGG